MDYAQTLEYLYSRLPMFSKQGASAIKKDLTNTLELCRRLGNPERGFKCIHVAGTNGKGSVSHMLAAVLQTAGYRTGLYTSPHLRDFRERIRIDGEMITENEVIAFTQSQLESIEEIEPSFFELTVAMAFRHFQKHQVDIAVIETGLGGRLDSTNVITPLLSVITNIGFDHTSILGNTLPEIAFEKAGIIKEHIPVVIGERHPETDEVFISKAASAASAIRFAQDSFLATPLERIEDHLLVNVRDLNTEVSQELELDLAGSYQTKNLQTVLCSLEELRPAGFKITQRDIQSALTNVKGLTGLQGRWQTLCKQPLIICDTGHNEHGIREVLRNIDATPYQQLHMVIGMVKDKDISAILSMLPKNARYYLCAPNIERAKAAEELKTEAFAFGLSGAAYASVPEALSAAKATASPKDLIFVGGSTFVVAEII